MTYEDVQAAALAIADRTERDSHDVGLVLGSGLSGFATSLGNSVTIDSAEIGFPQPKVEGHAGTIVSAEIEGVRLLASAGRVHTYEGWDLADVVFGVRTLAMAGCRSVILTNAAGGIEEGLVPGDLVALRDHINLVSRNPLVGSNDSRFGPRFPDLSAVYPENLRELVAKSAADVGIEYKEGVYAWQLGPSYETPAEIQMLGSLGADVVGMSTVPEAIALAHMGVPVVGLSLVTNLAAGISSSPLSHDEVTEIAAAARDRFAALLTNLIPRLGAV
ncbi:MAG: purine-nucleoside phosphorylase [Acidimicrobiia bacterium]|nr:purine-nucleoside phosphorylase [Acidimicrobiia bacterium]